MAKWGKYLSISKYSNELSSKNGNSPYDMIFAKIQCTTSARSRRRRGTGVAQRAGTAACATGVCAACTHEDGSARLLKQQ